jgi:hypothetical protein
MLHQRSADVPVLHPEADLPAQRHAVLALARGIGFVIIALFALALFLVGALALGAAVMMT